MNVVRVGILGYGKLGQFVVEQLLNHEPLRERFSIEFIWNRSAVDLAMDEDEILNLSGMPLGESLESVLAEKELDVVVELAHPNVARDSAELILPHADFIIGSPTVFADHGIDLMQLSESSESKGHIYLATGAAWGLRDIQKMNRMGLLRGLFIKMSFHADSLKLNGQAKERLDLYRNDDYSEDALMVQGTVRSIARQAPNNSNTMIALAMTQGIRGLEQTTGELWAHKDSHDHRIEIEVEGPQGFTVRTRRVNPAKKDAVTGSLTFFSFLNSIVEYGMGNDDIIFY